MHCLVDPDPAAFAANAWPLLARDPVRNNIICTHVEGRIRGHIPTAGDELWLRVHTGDGELVGAAMCTPPRGILFAVMPEPAARAIADWAARHRPDLPSISGPSELSGPAADRFAELTGRPATPTLTFPAFRLDTVDSPAGVAGRPRAATAAETDLILAWMAAFDEEALPGGRQRPQPRAELEPRLAHPGLVFLWEVADVPVSMVTRSALAPPDSAGPRTPVVRISAVYTPPEHRGHGYASANVARLSQRSLDDGAECCMLYTDAGNPTSNKIYQEIGYRPVGESREWTFTG